MRCHHTVDLFQLQQVKKRKILLTAMSQLHGGRSALGRRRREERVGIPILDKNNFRLQSNFKTDTLLMPTAGVGVGAASQVSPN